jgi:hypothetical protein
MLFAGEDGREIIERLERRVRFLLRIHQVDLAKDAASYATEASRSNLMAVQHTVRRMYGKSVARDAANLVSSRLPSPAQAPLLTLKMNLRVRSPPVPPSSTAEPFPQRRGGT